MNSFKIYIITFIAINSLLIAQTEFEHNLDNVIVTANRIPSTFAEIGRSINIITKKEIELLPVTNIQDLLEYFSGVDIKQRGPEGVQADVSIRGGSFEQTLILIDGIKLTDPQTGHHNMNLPVSLSQIERIEILKGQGSRIYGANAFSGVINLITKTSSQNKTQVELSGGENGYYNLGVNLEGVNHSVAFGKTKSDGYRHNTEFDNYNFSILNSFNFSSAVIKSIYGYASKDFGGNSFYTVKLPNQAEKTKTQFAAISAEMDVYKFNVSPKIYWRNNKDEFIYFKNRPDSPKNNHESNSYGGEIQASSNILGGITSIGIEFSRDEIQSSNLGQHKREEKGVFLEQRISLLENLNINFGGYAYHYSQIEWRFWPGFDLAYNFTDNCKIFANYGQAFRVPSYTELFYKDIVTQGNSDLQPEESNNYEIGFNSKFGIITFNSSFFRKEGKNLIDYVLDAEDDLWKAQNFTEIITNGIEAGITLNMNNITNEIINSINIDYTYLDSDKASLELNSRYVLDHLKQDLTIKIFNKLPFGINQGWTINYEDRVTLGDHFTVDTKLSRDFEQFNLFVKASNLFNKSYEEIPGVPLPGRWIIGGVKFNIL